MNNTIQEKAKKIKLLIMDVDGVLTNSLFYFHDDGTRAKTFNVKDGLGLVLIHKMGIQTAIITGKKSKIVTDRAKKLNITHVYLNQFNKLPAFNDLLNKLNLTPDEVAYIGDDILDLVILTRVGLAAAPADAHELVKPHVDLITKANSGQGAVREICDLILKAQGHLDKIMEKALSEGIDKH